MAASSRSHSIPTAAERAIRRRIARRGPVPFAEYMAAALYGPGGYYTRAGANPLADYYTAPQVHPAFGALLAVQLFHLWTLLARPRPFAVIEAGAGDGLLCRDILTAARHLPAGFADALQYTLCDLRSAPGWESAFPNARRVVASALRLPRAGAAGCILSNELLDALPVHRVRMDAGRLRELYVALSPDAADGYEGVLFEQPGPPSTPRLQRRLDDLGIALDHGQTAEICLLLDDWATAAASALDAGFVITIDYGRAAADLYDPAQRPHGALTAYRAHRQTDAPLRDAGRQDITAQVDFTALRMAGEKAGLTAVGNVPQGWLLRRLGLQTIRRRGPPAAAGYAYGYGPNAGSDAAGYGYGYGYRPDAAGWLPLPADPYGNPPPALPREFRPGAGTDFAAAPAADDGRAWLAGLTHLARPGGLGDFRVLLQSKGVAERTAAAALDWLDDESGNGNQNGNDGDGDGRSDGDNAGRGYAPADLAALIPAGALRLGPERLRLFG